MSMTDATPLQLAADRVRRTHAERTIAAMNQFSEQATLIRGEAAKTRRHRPLRKIFGEAKDVLTAVCPCWMASPLSVSPLIAATGVFDYVIFDEASQVLPEDAVPAILRGKYVIVAGDNNQLPPSAFFATADEDDDADAEPTAYGRAAIKARQEANSKVVQMILPRKALALSVGLCGVELFRWSS